MVRHGSSHSNHPATTASPPPWTPHAIAHPGPAFSPVIEGPPEWTRHDFRFVVFHSTRPTRPDVTQSAPEHPIAASPRAYRPITDSAINRSTTATAPSLAETIHTASPIDKDVTAQHPFRTFI